MKRIIFFFLLYLSLIGIIKAEQVYYSEYSDLGLYTDIKPLPSDTLLFEEKTLYRWSHVKRNLGDYYYEFENSSNYPEIDYNDNIRLNYSNWSREVPENKNGRIVEGHMGYIYEDMKPVKFINIVDINTTNKKLYISEIEVYVNNLKIDYRYDCHLCSDNFNQYIKNNVYEEKNAYIKNDGYIIIDMKNYYNVEDINVIIYVTDKGNEILDGQVFLCDEYRGTRFFEGFLDRGFIIDNLKESPFGYYFANIYPLNPLYKEPLLIFYEIEATPFRKVEQSVFYRYSDLKYRYYNTTKEYKDGYSEYGDDYYNNKEDEKNFYRYKTRDKVTTLDNLKINNYETKLSDFITSSTTFYQIIGDINYKENGSYPITYRFPFIDITTDIIVDIEKKEGDCSLVVTNLEDKIKLLEKEVLELESQNNNLSEENNNILNQYSNSLANIDNLIVVIKEKELTLKEMYKDYNKLSDDYEHKNTSCKLVLDNNDKKIKDLEDKIISLSTNSNLSLSVKTNSLFITKISIVFIFILLILFIYYLYNLKKKSSK